MSKISLTLPTLEDCLGRYEDDDESVQGIIVCDSLPAAKVILNNRLTILLAQLKTLKLKDIK